MRETVTLTGMVLLSAPSGDFDRRLVLLTREGEDYGLLPWRQKTGQSSDGGQQAFLFWQF